jgi:large subunit ribosomal protein L23
MSKNIDKTQDIAYKVLVEPWITEASTAAAEMNKYIFKVAKNATKKNIKTAIEGLYNVSVITVRTINIPAKKRTRGKVVGKKPGFKKAIVKIKEGESIDLFGNK